MRHTTGSLHMWFLGAGVVVATLLGWSLGWAVTLAAIGCGAMLAAVFWIGRSSTQQVSAQRVSPDQVEDRR